MITGFLSELFSLDPDFAEIRKTDIEQSTRQAIVGFCEKEELPPHLRDVIRPLSGGFDDYVRQIDNIEKGRVRTGSYNDWLAVAKKTEKLAETAPVAATLIAVAALAAWVAALGKGLFFQPWEGHHPGWHVFPLILARNAYRANSLWAPRKLLKIASEFVGACKEAPFNEEIRSVLAQYREISSKYEKRYNTLVSALAWDLRESARDRESPNFRAEVAALLWTLGFVPQACLMKTDDGVPGYFPSLDLMTFLIDQCLQTVSDDSLMQYIWLDMKDRPPFDLRAHRELFALINVRFHTKQIHLFDEMAPESPSRSFARVVIDYFRGYEKAERSALQNLYQHSEIFIETDPMVTFQIRSLMNLFLEPGENRDNNWKFLADFAARILESHNRSGDFFNLGRRLDIPFYYLNQSRTQKTEETIELMEAYRCAGLWFWFMVTPPPPPASDPEAKLLLDEEKTLLSELRGARFIRLLPRLPAHYRRYGFNLDEAMHLEAPEGAVEREGMLKFDPFDQNLAGLELKKNIERLYDLFHRMRKVNPEYAAVRRYPLTSLDKFAVLLREHREESV